MIAPRARLLVAFVVIVWPALTLASFYPATAAWAAALLSLFVVVAIADALLSRRRLRSVAVAAPELIRLAKLREDTIDLRLTNEGNAVIPLRVALALPLEFEAADEELRVDLQPGRSTVASFRCTPSQRGLFRLERVLAETTSHLGLWKLRGRFAVSVELRVYPDLLKERRTVAAVFLHRGTPGVRAVRRVGKGRDFEQLRDYLHGDSVDDVHWKATAKRGHPVTKVFQVERTQEVYVIIDSSRLTARMAEGVPVLDHLINCALILCLAAGEQSDLFGLATFSDKVQSFVRARAGKAHYDLCRDALYRLESSRVTPDFGDLFTFLRLRLRRRALLVFLTALDDPALASDFAEKIELLSRQHLVLVNMIRPPQAAPLFAHGRADDVGEIYRRLGGHLVWNDLRELGKRLHHHGVSFSLVDQARLTSEVVGQYLQIKQRQLI